MLDLDRSSLTEQVRNNSRAFLNTVIEKSDVSDVELQTPLWDYAFFSTRHNSYSRTDFFLLDAKSTPYGIDTNYHNIVISDHFQVTSTLNIQNATKPQQIWWLHPPLLGKKDLHECLETPINSGTKPATLCI